MLGFLQYLLAIVIGGSADSAGATRGVDWAGVLLAVLGYALAVRVLGVLIARDTNTPEAQRLKRLLLISGAARVGALALFYVIAGRLGGSLIPAALGVEGWVLVPRFLQLLPFFGLVAGYAWGFHAATAALEVGPRTSLGGIADEFRQALLPLAALVPLILLEDLPRLAPPTSGVGRAIEIARALPAVQAFLILSTLFTVLLLLPFVFRLVLRAKPLPDGPLRRRLEAYALRIGLRYRDIVVWPTRNDVLNAAVIGAFPRFRYVLITDGLIKTLGEDEIEAVFAHEAGHAKRGHILMYFGFTSVLMLVGFVPAVANVMGAVLAPFPPLLRVVVMVLVWSGVVFGWVSRRFEQEADVFGIETLPLRTPDADPAQHPFARAMQRIGDEVGAIEEVTGWRHFSIADRVKFVRLYLTDETVRRQYRRSIFWLRTTLLCVIGAFGLSAAVQLPNEIRAGLQAWESRSVPANLLLTELHFALDDPVPDRRAGRFFGAAALASAAGRDEDAARWVRESVALAPRASLALLAYASTLERQGRPAGARLVWEEIADREDLDPRLREEARKRASPTGSR